VAKHSRDKPQRHVMLYHYLMESQAWKSLGAIPRAVYLDICKRYFGSNNGRIGYSVRCAANELSIGLATAKRALDALEDRGFIVVVRKGAFNLKLKHATEWRLTQFNCDVTTAVATKDFMTWTPEKNKTRYPQRKHSVSVAEALGSCSGTDPDSNTAVGSCSGTENPVLHPLSVAVAEHI
jgi:hypothetical protein